MSRSAPLIPLVSLLAAGLLGAALDLHAADVPLGHKDFYPSADRPIGFRGDGNGSFPGATPVTEWWEHTPKPGGGKGHAFLPADDKQKNIVWKTPMPGWSDSAPVPVGDRLYTICEPDFVVCLDAHTGKILWQDRLSPGICEGLTGEAAKKHQEILDIARATFLIRNEVAYSRGSIPKTKPPGYVAPPWVITEEKAKRYLECLRRSSARMRELDPDPVIQESFAGMIEACEKRDPLSLRKVAVDLAMQMKYKTTISFVWAGYVGLAVCPPVSDGERVYVIFGQGQVGCYDLNGRLLWAKRLLRFNRMAHAAHWPAPLLVGDVLVVRGALDGMWLTGFDKRTGQQVWDTQISQKANENHGAFAAHKVMRLAVPGGGKMDVIATNRGAIVRPSDGKILGTQPPYTGGNFKTASGHGVSRVAMDDLYLSSECGDIASSPAAVMKVTLVSRDEAKIEQVAVLESGNENASTLKQHPVVLTPEGTVWDGTGVWHMRTGKKVFQPLKRSSNFPRGCLVQVGRYIICNPLHEAAGRNNDDNRLCLCPFKVFEISNVVKGEAKLVATSNLLGGEEVPADIFFDRYLGYSLEEKRQALKSGYSGMAKWFGVRNNGVFASGNRIFLQSAMAAYCIGDPAVKFDWNPASRPEQITKQLAQP